MTELTHSTSAHSEHPDVVEESHASADRPDSRDDREGRPYREKKQFFKRRRVCPFAGDNAPIIDYKDVRLLMKFVSERGKIMPSRITAVSWRKQKELALAVKRARFLALMPFVNQ